MTSLSVIIPAYNASATIDAALGAVAAQSRPPDEVIVVDDGSTDGTEAMALRWSSLLPLSVLRLRENIGRGLGAGGARAYAIERSRGDLIALLDVDDYWTPDHLSVMERQFDRHGGVVTANYLMWIPDQQVGTVPASELVPVPPAEHQQLAILDENFVFVSSLFSRQLYDDVGPMRNIRCEDWDLWIRMVDSGARVSMPSQVTALYRQAPDSVSGTDKLLVGDIDLLESHRSGRPADQVAVIDRALRRRQARQAYLDGVRLADAGDIGGARRAWIRSLRTDPSLRRNRSQLNGRVAVRSAACLVAPRTMVGVRNRRQADARAVVGDRAKYGRKRGSQ